MVGGQRANLERALAAGDPWPAFRKGHVDATGPVISVRTRAGETIWLSVGFPAEATAYLVEKGSVAIDGVSF